MPHFAGLRIEQNLNLSGVSDSDGVCSRSVPDMTNLSQNHFSREPVESGQAEGA